MGSRLTFAQTGRLIDSEPFDVIVLNEQNQNKVLKVLPIDLPGRELPSQPRPADTLRVRLVSNPDEELEVSWGGIAQVQLFEQMVLSDAHRLMAEKKFDEAFEYLTFVHDKYPGTAGLDETIDQLLYSEASTLYQEGQLERSLLLLDEVFQRTPARRGLAAALERVLERSFETKWRDRDFTQLRRLYELVENKYPEALPSLLERWRQRMESIGVKALAQVQADVDAGHLREAYVLGRQLLEVWPATPGAAELVATVSQRYPLLRVGVQQAAAVPLDSTPLTRWNWAAQRSERLRMRHLFELVGVGPDGAEYACSVGSLQTAENNRALTVQIDAVTSQKLTAVDVAQLLLGLGDSHHPLFDTAWAYLVERVGAPDLMTATASFRRPHLRPASLLEVPLDGLKAADLSMAWVPYLPQEPQPDGRSYLVNPEYIRGTATQPREIIERQFDTPQRALRALRKGEIDLIDRAFPADIAQIKRDSQLNVTAYRVPTVHLLIPNYQRPHVGNRLFRRGILYAIDREKILKRDLLGGGSLPGCQVISGPFSRGISSDDPMAYGYDAQIEPRAYDPRHARTLIQLAQLELAAVAEQNAVTTPMLSGLTLAYPPHEIARVACAEIVEDLKIIGLPCTLRELPAGYSQPADDDWDLLYFDLTIPEPLVDARRLLATDGLVGSPSPHLNLALRQLERVDNWNRAGERLRVVHQLCFDDTTVVPLWQLVEHLVYRKGIQGMVPEPVSTYQNIEAWRLTAGP